MRNKRMALEGLDDIFKSIVKSRHYYDPSSGDRGGYLASGNKPQYAAQPDIQ
jgi:hypothetical protein